MELRLSCTNPSIWIHCLQNIYHFIPASICLRHLIPGDHSNSITTSGEKASQAWNMAPSHCRNLFFFYFWTKLAYFGCKLILMILRWAQQKQFKIHISFHIQIYFIAIMNSSYFWSPKVSEWFSLMTRLRHSKVLWKKKKNSLVIWRFVIIGSGNH